eukprot:TRINITY_DN12690_c0_g2_i3.p1 TRINITY_DN12690_c0_g2~~TRINITY_DN12690_c0_g2_i3.p1  ORF type:complete len:246 (+),score=23.61 TRINITY_DN12690_c0_g2_i3:143-880(+)
MSKNNWLHRRADTFSNKFVVLIEETVKPLTHNKNRLNSYFLTANNLAIFKPTHKHKRQQQEMSRVDEVLELSSITQRPRRTRKERLIRNAQKSFKTSVLQDNNIRKNAESFYCCAKAPGKGSMTRNCSNRELGMNYSTVGGKDYLKLESCTRERGKAKAKENVKALSKVASKNDLNSLRIVPVHKRCSTRMSLLDNKGVKISKQVKSKLPTEGKKIVPSHQYKKSLQTNYICSYTKCLVILSTAY